MLRPHPLLLASGLLWTLGGPARADDLPESAVAVGDQQGLLAVVQDSAGLFAAAAPVVTVIDGETRVDQLLADDGAAPDGQAGDGVYVAVMPDPPTGEALGLLLTDTSGKELWRDEVPITPGMPLPRVDFVTEGDHVRAKLATVLIGGAAGGLPPAPGTAGTPAAPSGSVPPPPGSSGAALPTGVTGGAGLIVAGMLGLMGLLAGFVLGLVVGRRGQARVALSGVGDAPVPGPLAGLPAVRGGQQVWLVPGDDALPAVTVALARHLASGGPVLLSVSAARRPAIADALQGLPGVFTVADRVPSPDALLDAAELLAPVGRPTILVEGAEGLEPPERGEHADAVLLDLLEHAGDDTDVLVLLSPGNWPGVEPTARVAVDADGTLGPA